MVSDEYRGRQLGKFSSVIFLIIVIAVFIFIFVISVIGIRVIGIIVIGIIVIGIIVIDIVVCIFIIVVSDEYRGRQLGKFSFQFKMHYELGQHRNLQEKCIF